MIVIFDRQHYGKPGKSDLGAGVDLDGDGKVETAEMEANLTPLYIHPARRLLEASGHSSYVFDNGWYADRHNRANALAKANPAAPFSRSATQASSANRVGFWLREYSKPLCTPGLSWT